MQTLFFLLSRAFNNETRLKYGVHVPFVPVAAGAIAARRPLGFVRPFFWSRLPFSGGICCCE